MRKGSISAKLDGASAAVGLTKTTTGIVTLSANNDYDGTTTITGGRLEITDQNQLGDLAKLIGPYRST